MKIYKIAKENLAHKNVASFKGRPFWSGCVNILDGTIEETHTYQTALRWDFHHSMYFSMGAIERMEEGESIFFWVDEQGIHSWPFNEKLGDPDLINKIKRQIIFLPQNKQANNISKIAVKPRYYGKPDPIDPIPHDYDPNWEYEEDLRPKRKMMNAFIQAAKDIETKHMGEFRDVFTRFRIVFVKYAGGGLAAYASGTYNMPVIMIDLRLCAQTQKEEKDSFSLYQVAITTLMHELRHAYQEQEAMENDMDEQELEDDAEDFGMRFM